MIYRLSKPAWKLIFLLSISLILSSCSNEPIPISDIMEEWAKNGRREIGSPFNGAVLIAKNGQVHFKNAYGFKHRESETPNNVQTKFPIGSITKQFTAMLIMQMVEEGTLSLEASIDTYLPYFPQELGKELTLHRLLSHTSGLPHYEGLLRNGLDEATFSSSSYTPQELAVLVSKVSLAHQPGTRYHYSSLGYMLLGALLEEVSGKSYAILLKNRITEPLGLKHTGFADNTFIKQHTAPGYAFIEDESFRMLFRAYGGDFKAVPFRDQSNKFSTGGMHSTVEDLFIWSEALRNHKLLSPSATKKMWTPNKEGYCYGWIRNWDDLVERNVNVRMYTHGGALRGHRSSITLFDDGTTIIFLANVNPIKDPNLIHQLYLTTHGLEDDYGIQGYPDRSSLKEFESEGGIKALQRYFDKLSDACGYEVLPSDSSIARIMYLYYEEGNTKIGDSLKEAYFNLYAPSENAINRIGYNLLKDNCEAAIALFKENTERHPQSANAWDSLGEGYLGCKNAAQAIPCFTRAVEIAKADQDSNLALFQQHLQRAKTTKNP
ncbi:serine hydrolase [Spongiimicrobium salis]|uniref:serine hydrolase n=1 Tax=Spongiimicrobium salis TaxID=1667022 RepID=UPI00374D3F15